MLYWWPCHQYHSRHELPNLRSTTVHLSATTNNEDIQITIGYIRQENCLILMMMMPDLTIRAWIFRISRLSPVCSKWILLVGSKTYSLLLFRHWLFRSRRFPIVQGRGGPGPTLNSLHNSVPMITLVTTLVWQWETLANHGSWVSFLIICLMHGANRSCEGVHSSIAYEVSFLETLVRR